MKKFCFLYNPSTNRERSFQKFNRLKKITRGWSGVEYHSSKNSDHLKMLAGKASQSFEVVVACGGDGTVRDVAASIKDSSATLGIIPLGSGNDFSKSLQLPSNLRKALKVLYNRKHKAVDLGKCNDFYFINTLGFGFDGQTNRYAGQSSVNIGSLRYLLAALKTTIKMSPFEAEIVVDDTNRSQKSWIMLTIANGRVEGGNFVVAPNASPFDGVLELLAVEPVPKWYFPFVIPFFVMGKPGWLSCTRYHKAQVISISLDRPVFIHCDGEQIETDERSFHIEILPKAIPVIC